MNEEYCKDICRTAYAECVVDEYFENHHVKDALEVVCELRCSMPYISNTEELESLICSNVAQCKRPDVNKVVGEKQDWEIFLYLPESLMHLIKDLDIVRNFTTTFKMPPRFMGASVIHLLIPSSCFEQRPGGKQDPNHYVYTALGQEYVFTIPREIDQLTSDEIRIVEGST